MSKLYCPNCGMISKEAVDRTDHCELCLTYIANCQHIPNDIEFLYDCFRKCVTSLEDSHSEEFEVLNEMVKKYGFKINNKYGLEQGDSP